MSLNIKAVTKSLLKHKNIVAMINTVVYSVQVDQRDKIKGSGLHWLANADMSSHHKKGYYLQGANIICGHTDQPPTSAAVDRGIAFNASLAILQPHLIVARSLRLLAKSVLLTTFLRKNRKPCTT